MAAGIGRKSSGGGDGGGGGWGRTSLGLESEEYDPIHAAVTNRAFGLRRWVERQSLAALNRKLIKMGKAFITFSTYTDLGPFVNQGDR